jgi:tetratricopeptide (TPR) repeat protein
MNMRRIRRQQLPPTALRRAGPNAIALAFCLVVLGVAVFWNAVGGVFLLDDFASIHQNASIRTLWPIWDTLMPPNRGETVAGRPIANLTLAVNYAMGGLDIRGYHVVNLFLHLCCALLLYGLVRRILLAVSTITFNDQSARYAAFAAASLWMVHPLQSEVVAYVVARTESLMALFYLLTLYGAVRSWTDAGEGSRSAWNLIAIGSCGVGMACKESMVTAPIAVALLDRALFFESFGVAFNKRRSLYLGLVLTWSILAALVSGTPRGNSAGFFVRKDAASDVSLGGYLRNQALVVPRYFRLLLWPVGLVFDYGQGKPLTFLQTLPGAGLLIGSLLTTVLAWWKSPRLGVAPMLCMLTLAPTTLVPVITEIGAERRMYLPSAAIIAGIVVGSARLRLTGRGAVAVWLVAVTALAVATVKRTQEYDSSYRMWTTVVERWPHGRAYLNLAVEADASGRKDEVLPLLRHAVADFPDAEYALGQRLYEAQAYAEAIDHLERFLRLRPGHYQEEAALATLVRAFTDLGIQRSQRGDVRGAVDAFEGAVSRSPKNADVLRNLSVALMESGNFERAEKIALQTLQERPGDDVAIEVLAKARGQATPHR